MCRYPLTVVQNHLNENLAGDRHRNIQLTIDLYGQLKAVEIENPSPYNF